MASFVSLIVVIVIENYMTGQLINLASVGIKLHKYITNNDEQLGQPKSIHKNHIIDFWILCRVGIVKWYLTANYSSPIVALDSFVQVHY